ncbi:AraC family transcriptional regulator [Neorhizobium petrolearium]|uniref:AraC family transcriptional regulator n=1 Tax=Neorhizobium petrolearium TaxID=515361 RepID=A0ABY8MBX1_9HYPH|nr:AraC family transcriptional regulator [Neorhizobium petrolearium]MCC2613357.1 AraC family transcriptional regulator [Neorhizobium petrolearium]WGI71351.1 AraC family transcriptional regulator [Neorhizobium petrolearium]
MSDPLAEIVSILKPVPSIAKLVMAGGAWLVERRELGSPFYCAIVEGRCHLTISGRAPIVLAAGDFVMVPEIHSFTMSSLQPPPRGTLPQRLETSPGVFRLGDPASAVDVTAMVGHCAFAATDRQMLVSLLPDVIHVQGQHRLTNLVRMIHRETVGKLAARDMVLTRLLEVLLIEALRSAGGATASPGLLRGLSDHRLAPVLRRIHQDPGGEITVEDLARNAAMSRSTFFDRFRREVGVAPMEYVTSWRMALAKEMLLRREASVAEIAARIGYASASAFNVAFTRHVGTTPGAFAGRA